MSKIHAFCMPLNAHNVEGIALDEDGYQIAGHISSDAIFSERDMITSGWKNEKYDARYPDGWEVVWLGEAEDPDNLLPTWLLKRVEGIRERTAKDALI